MAFLFVIENSAAKPNTETLLIEPYKTIWERDKSKDKSNAIKDFSFIEFSASKKKSNPYAGYDDETRFEKLKMQIYKDVKWKPDNLILEGVEKLKNYQTEGSPTYSYYLATLNAATKMKEFFNTFKINERNSKDVPLYKPNEIITAISNTDKVLQSLSLIKERVEQELFEQVKTKSNKTINPFEM